MILMIVCASDSSASAPALMGPAVSSIARLPVKDKLNLDDATARQHSTLAIVNV